MYYRVFIYLLWEGGGEREDVMCPKRNEFEENSVRHFSETYN